MSIYAEQANKVNGSFGFVPGRLSAITFASRHPAHCLINS